MPLIRIAKRVMTRFDRGAPHQSPPPMQKRSVAGGRPPRVDAVTGLAPGASTVAPPSTVETGAAEAEALATIEAGCQEVKERVEAGEPVMMLDVRNPDETATGIIEGAILIPLPELEARWEEVKDANEIVCYCAKGGRSLKAATFLREKGVFNATSLEGGMGKWRAVGGQTVPPAS